MTRKRVLIIQRILVPYRLSLFNALAGLPGIDLTLASGQPLQESALETAEPSGLFRHFPIYNRFTGKNETLIWSSGLLKLIKPDRVDVIIAEFNPRILSNLVVCLLARLRGIRFIWWGHGMSPRSVSSKLITKIRLVLIKWADGIILYEDSMAARMKTLGVPEHKIFVARNTIDIQYIARLRKASYPDGRNGILYIGRLIAPKKITLLIQAFSEILPALNPDLRLMIMGDGPERKNLTDEMARLGIADRVDMIPGSYDESRIAPYFNRSLVSVSPGYIGLSAIHSLAYGVPVLVCGDEPHSPEFAALSHGLNAEIIVSDSVSALSEAMLRLVSNPDYLKGLHDHALNAAANWRGIDNMAGAFEKAIDHVLEN